MKSQFFLLLFLFPLLTFGQSIDHVCPIEGHHHDLKEQPHTPPSDHQTPIRAVQTLDCNCFNPKVLNIKMHVFRDENGERNFGPATEYLLQGIVDRANEKLANNQIASHNGNPMTPHVPNTGLQFNLAEIEYLDQQNWAYPNITYPTLDPDYLDVFMVEQLGDWEGTGCNDANFCTGIFCCAGGWAPIGGLNGRAVLNRAYFRYTDMNLLPDCVAGSGGHEPAFYNKYADILIHEFGHMANLFHNFSNDGCDDTPILSNSSAGNNHMSNNGCFKGNFTCCQLDRMHTHLESSAPNFMDITVLSTEPVFHFEGEDEIEKTEFCFGETIFLDGRDTENEKRRFIALKEIDPSGNENYFYETGNNWVEVGRENLTEMMEEASAITGIDYHFRPGYTYAVKLAVGNDCTQWAEEWKEFTVVCCEEGPSASFIPNGIDFEKGSYTIVPENYDLHENHFATHEWYVFSSPNFTGGPFTPEASFNGPTFSFSPAKYELFYFITHRVITECGEFCYTTYIINGGPGEKGGKSNEEDKFDPYDCSILDEVFPSCNLGGAPTNLSSAGGILSWTPVVGATSYQVIIQIGGFTSCECGGQIPTGYGYSVTTNSMPIPSDLLKRCFEWRVIANCPKGSTTSESACYYPRKLNGGVEDTQQSSRRSQYSNYKEINVYPNPARDELFFSIKDQHLIAQGFELQVLNTSGQVVHQQTFGAETTEDKLHTAGYTNGCYLLRFIDSQGISYYKKVMIIHQD